jgi:hypothetical protein
MIGYVSIPFGKKHGVDFTDIYRRAIFSAPDVAAGSEPSGVALFREDGEQPQLASRHKRRLDTFTRGQPAREVRLREEIQKHIVLADFVVADISHANANVMLEVGFAQGIGKPIIYITHTPENIPSNLGDLGRRFDYNRADLQTLKRNLWHKIRALQDDIGRAETDALEQGGNIQYFSDRRHVHLDQRLAEARDTIQILTTNLTTVSADYLDSIEIAIGQAADAGRTLHVSILTSDPSSPFIEARANQLKLSVTGYIQELTGSLESIAAKLMGIANCRVMTYQDFPVQLWHRIDDVIYIGTPALVRRSRLNCVFAVSVDAPGIKETYLDHFEKLQETATEHVPRPGQSEAVTSRRNALVFEATPKTKHVARRPQSGPTGSMALPDAVIAASAAHGPKKPGMKNRHRHQGRSGKRE